MLSSVITVVRQYFGYLSSFSRVLTQRYSLVLQAHLGTVQVHAVQFQSLGVVQEEELCVGRRLAPGEGGNKPNIS